MPLTKTTTAVSFVTDDRRRAIGIWMTDEGAHPVQAVRVFVTYDALWQIDPAQPHDVPAAIGIFEQNRDRIEAAASNKFDVSGVDDGEHEGQPLLMVQFNDLPG